MTPARKELRIDALRERVRALENARPAGARASRERRRPGVPTGWPSVDREALGGRGLPRSRLHEWCGIGGPCGSEGPRGAGGTGAGERSGWTPPLSLLAHLARRGLRGGGSVLWIGRAVWPRLHGDPALLERSLFVDPPDRERRLWAIDTALRSPAASVVVADGSELRIEESRRLQLAAEAGDALALLARPAEERGALSVAASRWTVARTPDDGGDRPRWKLALQRLKGASTRVSPVAFGGSTLLGRWALEWDDEKSVVVELPPLADRPRAASPRAGLGSA